MMALRTLMMPVLGAALLADAAGAETVQRHEAFGAWRAYCLDDTRPKTEAVGSYCDGFLFAASFVRRDDPSDAGQVGTAAPPATMPDGRRAAAGMGRAPASGHPASVAATAGPPESSGALRVLAGGWIDAQ